MEKFKFHFRQAEIPFIIVDEMVRFKNGYGIFDYRIIYENGEASGYLTEKGQKQAEVFGRKLLNEEYSEKTLKKLKKIEKDLKNLNYYKKIKKIQKKDLVSAWKMIKKLIDELIEAYKFCESPMLAPLEKIIVSEIPPEHIENVLVGRKINTKISNKALRAIKVVYNHGQMKLKIHKEFERLFLSLEDLFTEIARIKKIPILSLFHFSVHELENLLEKNKTPNGIDKTINGVVFLPLKNGKKWKTLTGKKFKAWRKKLVDSGGQEIRGVVASEGKARGKAKIHLSLISPIRLNKGSVLVTGMTIPQMIPYMKNAAAIITDEGGLTCHAAIISRELKIPCIIGTGNATRILKDGDLVEVDANKGIVKIIKQA